MHECITSSQADSNVTRNLPKGQNCRNQQTHARTRLIKTGSLTLSLNHQKTPIINQDERQQDRVICGSDLKSQSTNHQTRITQTPTFPRPKQEHFGGTDQTNEKK